MLTLFIVELVELKSPAEPLSDAAVMCFFQDFSILDWLETIPDAPCMPCMPTLTPETTPM